MVTPFLIYVRTDLQVNQKIKNINHEFIRNTHFTEKEKNTRTPPIHFATSLRFGDNTLVVIVVISLQFTTKITDH